MPWSFDEDGIKVRTLEALSAPGVVEHFAGVVDLGAGAGLWRHHATTLPIGALHWTAVEVFAANVPRFKLRTRYDAVRIADFRRIKFGALPGRLFIFGDVLEHLERADALDVIRRAASMGTVVVVMPFHPSTSAEQGPVDGNEWERHRYVWGWAEFLEAIAPIVPGVVDVIAEPPGTGRNKGAVILWHPSHAAGS